MEGDIVRHSAWFGPNQKTSEENRRYKAASWVNYIDTADGVPIYTETEYHGGVLDMVGELRKLLIPILALQVYGSATEITAKIDTVANTIKIVRDHNDFREDFPERKQTISDLEKIIADMEEDRPRMEEAERFLAEAKWKYDPDVKKIRELPGGEKGRTGGFLARCCVAVYVDQYYGQKLTAGVLQDIKKHLSEFFPEEYLDASRKGSIYWAVKNRGVGPTNKRR